MGIFVETLSEKETMNVGSHEEGAIDAQRLLLGGNGGKVSTTSWTLSLVLLRPNSA